MPAVPHWREDCMAVPPTIRRVSGERCVLLSGHKNPHMSGNGVSWEEERVTPNPNAPQIHRVDRCANLTCSNRPGEGTFTIFVAGPALHEPMRKAITLALCAPCGEAMKAVWPR